MHGVMGVNIGDVRIGESRLNFRRRVPGKIDIGADKHGVCIEEPQRDGPVAHNRGYFVHIIPRRLRIFPDINCIR